MEPFKLHAVIKFRKQLEETAQQHLFAILEDERAAKQVVTDHAQDIDRLYALLQQEKVTGTTVTRLIMLENRIDLIREALSQAQEALDQVQAQVQSRRQALLKASRDRRIIEKMQEKQDHAYAQFLHKKEMTMLDELAVLFRKK